MKYPVYIGIAVAGAIVCFYIYETVRVRAMRPCLNGLWTAPDSFCRQAEIKSACFFIGDSAMFVFMEGHSGVIVGDRFPCSITAKTSGSSHGNVEFDVSCPGASPLPDCYTARYDPESGMLGFYSGDELHMQLFKPHGG